VEASPDRTVSHPRTAAQSAKQPEAAYALVRTPASASRAERVTWRRDAVPMEERKPRLLRALNALYAATADPSQHADAGTLPAISTIPSTDRGPDIPWLHAPEDSWL